MPTYTIEKDGKKYKVTADSMEQAMQAIGGQFKQGPTKMSDLDTASGAVQSFVQGNIPFADEIAARGRAAVDMAQDALMDNPLDDGGGQSWSDRVEMFRQADEANRRNFAEQNPGSALGLELAGGLLSPLNVVGGLGAVRTGSQLGGMVNNTTRGMGSVRRGLNQALNREMYSPQALRQSMGLNAARGAAEGALYGAGAAEPGSRLEGAAGGAGVGAGVSAGLTGALGGLGRAISRTGYAGGAPAVSEPLRQEDGSFMPIWLAADRDGVNESTVGGLYRGVPSAVGGASGRAQEKPFIEAADRKVAAAQARRSAFDRAKQTRIERLNTEATAANRAADDAAVNARRAAEDTQRQASEAADRAYDAQRADSATQRAAMEAENAQFLNDQQINFRAEAAQNSVDLDNRAAVLNPNSTDFEDVVGTNSKLLEFWNGSQAFRMVKDKVFNWGDDIYQSLKKEFAEDPDFVVSNMADMPEMIRLLEANLGGTAVLEKIRSGTADAQDLISAMEAIAGGPQAQVNGDVFMAMRNVFARAANSTKDPQKFRALNKIRARFDQKIKETLGEESDEWASFQNQKDAYKNWLNYQSAINSARTRNGLFTASDYLTVGNRFGDYSKGTQSLQKQADSVTALEAQSQKLADTDAAKRGTSLEQAKAARNEAKRAASEARRASDRQTTDRLKKAKQQAQDEKVRLKSRTNFQKTQDALDAQVEQAKKERERLQRTRSAERPNLPSQVFAASVLGSAPAVLGSAIFGPWGLAATVPAGAAVAKGLLREGTQEFFAGQKGWQRALAKALREGDTYTANQILSRQAARRSQEEEE